MTPEALLKTPSEDYAIPLHLWQALTRDCLGSETSRTPALAGDRISLRGPESLATVMVPTIPLDFSGQLYRSIAYSLFVEPDNDS